MYDGHQFVKLCGGEWVFDITEFKGYKVELNKTGTVDKVDLAFEAKEVNNKVSFEKFIAVPVKVLKETREIILEYKVSAFV